MSKAMKYDIFTELEKEIDDFDKEGFYLVGKPKSEVAYKGSKKGEKGGYYYSQKDTLESVDLADASKYKKGIRDEEGQRKTYLNIVSFYRDVMKMKININAANYIFEPTSLDYTWPVFLMGRKFSSWSQEESYDDQIDEYGHDLSTYGTAVTKRCVGNTERVPLRTLRNTQSAKTLYDGCINGGYAIIEDEKHYNSMTDYPDWNTEGMSKGSTHQIFERYGLVPKKLYDNWKTNGGVLETFNEDDAEMVLCQSVLAPKDREKNSDKAGRILWMEIVDEESFPLEEVHAEKVDGRWLGRGEIEKQLENQIARNLTANLRRRGLLWATKKIYQSSDDEVQSQLLMEVRDGEVVHVKPNGQISQVNTASQHLSEFNSDEESWKENSQQRAFAFNIATGENLPSGTSFSLGVVLDRAVSSHFSMVRNKYSNFLKRSFFDQLIPIFLEEHSDAHTQQIPLSATDIENLREEAVLFHSSIRIFDAMMDRSKRRAGIDPEAIRDDILNEMARNPFLFVDIPEEFYPNIHYFMRLNIDDDTGPDVQTLTTLYQSMVQQGDERAEQVLKQIMAKQGKSLSQIAGRRPQEKPVNPNSPSLPGPDGPGGQPPVPTPSDAAPVAA
eukprot:GHVL01030664.1.p1 GENE.GHVL01030664.1~~GHVL01030664.1.p1  ORF type:complete len:613 (-),score=36.32 GHVL01030664.1:489-2327(-)